MLLDPVWNRDNSPVLLNWTMGNSECYSCFERRILWWDVHATYHKLITKEGNHEKLRKENFRKNGLITGGGAYNSFLIDRIREYSNCNIIIPENKIVDFKEALVFGFLGVLRLRNEVNCLRSVTGAKHDHCSGKIFLPHNNSRSKRLWMMLIEFF